MSVLIGKHIVKSLNVQSISEYVGDRIYPLVIPEGAPSFPFIVYERISVNTEYTKDGSDMDNVQVRVDIVSKDYEESIDITQKVRYLLEGVKASYPDFIVNSCKMVGISEGWIKEADAYIQSIIFEFKTNDL